MVKSRTFAAAKEAEAMSDTHTDGPSEQMKNTKGVEFRVFPKRRRTNDPQAPYTVKPNGPVEAATAPLLSDTDIALYVAGTAFVYPNGGEAMGLDDAAETGGKFARDFYEAKIASGELMVCKTTRRVQVPLISREGSTVEGCEYCGHMLCSLDSFCSVCGAKILH